MHEGELISVTDDWNTLSYCLTNRQFNVIKKLIPNTFFLVQFALILKLVWIDFKFQKSRRESAWEHKTVFLKNAFANIQNSTFFLFFYFSWAQRKGFPFTSNISVYEERFPLSIWPKETTKQSDVYCSGQTDRIQNIGYFIGYSSLIAISKNIIPPIFSITCFQL